MDGNGWVMLYEDRTTIMTYLGDLKQVELKHYKKETWVWEKERSELKCLKILELFRIMLLLQLF